jgi:excisionase family DNA binding protein
VDRLLSIEHCAEFTDTSSAFWRKLLYRRAIPSVKVGRLVRIRQSDLEAWLRLGLRPGPLSAKVRR